VSKRLRLLEVVIQPVFVLDNGDTLKKISPQPTVVSADEWPHFAQTEFVRATEDLERRIINAEN
jgi:hypothetical protein